MAVVVVGIELLPHDPKVVDSNPARRGTVSFPFLRHPLPDPPKRWISSCAVKIGTAFGLNKIETLLGDVSQLFLCKLRIAIQLHQLASGFCESGLAGFKELIA